MFRESYDAWLLQKEKAGPFQARMFHFIITVAKGLELQHSTHKAFSLERWLGPVRLELVEAKVYQDNPKDPSTLIHFDIPLFFHHCKYASFIINYDSKSSCLWHAGLALVPMGPCCQSKSQKCFSHGRVPWRTRKVTFERDGSWIVFNGTKFKSTVKDTNTL